MSVILPQHFLLPLLWPTNNYLVKLMHIQFICTRSIIVLLETPVPGTYFLLAYIEFQISYIDF